MTPPAEPVKCEHYACRCTRCGECGGSGSIWVDMYGHYLGRRRSDDLDELERCEECDGTGIMEECDLCQSFEETGG